MKTNQNTPTSIHKHKRTTNHHKNEQPPINHNQSNNHKSKSNYTKFTSQTQIKPSITINQTHNQPNNHKCKSTRFNSQKSKNKSITSNQSQSIKTTLSHVDEFQLIVHVGRFLRQQLGRHVVGRTNLQTTKRKIIETHGYEK
jgi:hypothetical protein